VATSLAATAETDLRKTLAQKLLKSGRQTKEGNFFSVRLSSSTSETSVNVSCYYCQVEAPSESDAALSDSQGEISKESQQFVVCFISFLDSALYLFRSELEQYTQDLALLLDKELCLPSSSPHPSSSDSSVFSPDQPTDHKELTQLSTGIHGYLRQWPCNVLEYLARTIQYMGGGIQYLIYSALLNASLQISGATPQQEEDVRRFYKCCNLSPLLEQLQADSLAVDDSMSDSDELWQLRPVVVTITFLPDQAVTFDRKYVCKFCESASDALTSMDVGNVARIRDLLESVKLRFVRNLNTLKRFLKQAEIDHYALYRALSYLRKCGCGDLLLRYVKLDAGTDTLKVLAVLETFIKTTKLTLV
jgi:hypothetical protein